MLSSLLTLALPFVSSETSVRFTSDPGVELVGTLSLPTGKGPFPGAVLLSGAGPHDRDGSGMGHKPLRVLAADLTQRGVCVLRFDERGVGASSGDFAASTPLDLARDASAALGVLRATEGVSPDDVGWVAHSEGGLVATLAARASTHGAFVVLLAGPGLAGAEGLAAQAERTGRAMGLPAALIEANQRIYGDLAEIVLGEPDPEAAAERMRSAMHAELDTLPLELKRAVFGDRIDAVVEQTVAQFNAPRSRFVLTHDPRPDLVALTVPILALVGSKDLIVEPAPFRASLVELFRESGNRRAQVDVLPGLNHFFQEAKTGSPAEVPTLDHAMSPLALERIGAWIVETFERSGD